MTASDKLPEPEPEAHPASDYLKAASDLRVARRLHEAEALLAEALRRFPTDADLLGEAARVAEWRGDWAAAASRWNAVCRLLPDNVVALVGHARALMGDGQHDAADAALRDAARQFPDNFEILIARAECPTRRADWSEGLRRWDELRVRFPDRLEPYLASARAFRELGRTAEADGVLAEAAERFPNQPRPHVERALLAHDGRDWHEAAQRWERVRGGFPEEPVAYVLGAVALRELGRLDRAEDVISAGSMRFPNDFGIANESAWLATRRGDWDEALKRWHLLSGRFPGSPRGPSGAAMILCEMGRYVEAEETLQSAVERFAREPQPLVDYARFAEARGHPMDAARRWAMLRDRFPEDPLGYSEGARALRAAQEAGCAEVVLAEAVSRFPRAEWALRAWANAAMARQDWAAAAERWQRASRLISEPAVNFGLAAALRELGRLDEADALLAEAAGASLHADDERLSLKADDFVGHLFKLDGDGTIAPICLFLPDGLLVGPQHRDQSRWRIENGVLQFLDQADRITTAFTRRSMANGLLRLSGYYLGHEFSEPAARPITLVLAQQPAAPNGIVRLPKPDRSPSQSLRRRGRVAVLLRSHLDNHKLRNLVEIADNGRRFFDLYVTFDCTNANPGPGLPNLLPHSAADCQSMGLPYEHPRLLWWCSDYPFYFSLRDIPDYEFYIMVEYDVHFPDLSAKFLDDLIDKILVSGIDAFGTRLRPGHLGDICAATLRNYDRVYTYFFPLVGLSREAIENLQEARRAEAARGTSPEDLMHCEAFVPSQLHHAGFDCVDLDYLLPGAYRNETMIVPGRYWGRPGVALSVADSFAPYGRIMHPVYDDETFLAALLARVNDRRSMRHFVEILDDPFLQKIPASLRRRYAELADAKLAA